MQKKFSVGVDISAKSLDIAVSKDGKSFSSFKIKNEVKSIVKFFSKYKEEPMVVSMENTGRYNRYLYQCLSAFNFEVYVLNPLHLSKSMGLSRGKNDKIDAIRIAKFTIKNLDELQPWAKSSKAVEELKILLSERGSKIKTRKKLLTQQKDYQLMEGLSVQKQLMELNRIELKLIDQHIKTLEQAIRTLIKSNDELKKMDAFAQSVTGVGEIVSWYFIAKTEGFSKIKTPRKMACLTGVAPFGFQSGTSINRKTKTSVFADKKMKTLLHMAALRAVRLEGDMKKYYLRKIEEGKNKMSILNAVRNKLIHRIYAVVKQQKFYEINLLLS
jgi:transposase